MDNDNINNREKTFHNAIREYIVSILSLLINQYIYLYKYSIYYKISYIIYKYKFIYIIIIYYINMHTYFIYYIININ